jgi:hypothetical protein
MIFRSVKIRLRFSGHMVKFPVNIYEKPVENPVEKPVVR